MELLRGWCNDAVGLSRHVRSFEADFRDGCLFGEILDKYGLMDNARKLRATVDPQVMVANFNLLQPALRAVNVSINGRVASNVMTEKPGAAANIVYQLKVAIESAQRVGETGPASAKAEKHRTLARTTVSASRTLRAPHEEMQQQTLDRYLRLKVDNPKELRMSHHLSKFTDEMERQQAAATRAAEKVRSAGTAHPPTPTPHIRSPRGAHARIAQEKATSDALRHAVSEEERDRVRQRHDHREAFMAASRRRHAATMRSKRDVERDELRWELTTRQTRAQRAEEEARFHEHELREGINSFERTLRATRGEGSGGAGDDDDGEGDNGGADETEEEVALAVRNTLHATPAAHLSRLEKLLPQPATAAADATNFLTDLKARRGIQDAERREREVRRRRVLLEQSEAQARVDAQRRDEDLLEALQRQSVEERAVAERLWRTRQEREVMRENRRLRQEQYEEQRRADMAVRVERLKAKFTADIEDYQAAVRRDRARFAALEQGREQARRSAREAACRTVAEGIVSVALAAAQYREDAGQVLPARVWREMSTVFVSGADVHRPSGSGTTRAGAPAEAEGAAESMVSLAPTPASEDPRPVSAMDDEDVTLYLDGAGDWRPDRLIDAAGPVVSEAELQVAPGEGKTMLLGETLYAIIDAAAPPPPPPPPRLGEARQLRVAIVGRPFSGKTRTALSVASALNLELILPTELVHAAVDEYRATASASASIDADAAEASPGARAAAALDSGGVVPDDVTVDLILGAVAAVDGSRAGFVIDGFPSTAPQLALLEKGLTGYEPVVDVKKKPPQSRLVPPPGGADEPPPPPKPGLDAVIRLDVAEDLVRKRALGRRVDPETGDIYHLELAPPEDAETQARLVAIGSEAKTAAMLTPLLQAFRDAEKAFDQWTTALKVLRVVDASRTEQLVAADVHQLVDELAQAKAAAPATEQATAAPIAEAADLAPAAEAAPAADTPAPVPPLPLEREVASSLLTRWREMETTYLASAGHCLGALRDMDWSLLQHTTSQAQAFEQRLAFPDDRQELVADAQEAFNAMPLGLRATDAGKGELHALADGLQESLWDLVDRKRDEAEVELRAMASSGFVSAFATTAVTQAAALMQAETDRCASTLALCHAYYSARAVRGARGYRCQRAMS